MKPLNLVGQRFGRLVIISRAKNDKYGNTRWICRCDCGREKEIGSRLFRRLDFSKSCGCVQKERGTKSYRFKGYQEISKTYWSRAQRNARYRGLKFLISIQDAWEVFLKQNKQCALSGIPLTFGTSCNTGDGNASLDRIDSCKEYTIDNIQWVDKRINWMKQEFPQNEFIQLCRLVVGKVGNSPLNPII